MQRVTTNYGTLEGDILESGVAVFRGVPYASPPVGNLRWRRPIPPKKWEGVRPAKEFSLIYPQTDDWPFYAKEFGRPSDMTSGEVCIYMIFGQKHRVHQKTPILEMFLFHSITESAFLDFYHIHFLKVTKIWFMKLKKTKSSNTKFKSLKT